ANARRLPIASASLAHPFCPPRSTAVALGFARSMTDLPAPVIDGGGMWSTVVRGGAARGLVVDRCGRRGRGAPVCLGTHTPRLDEKGRLFLPAKYRDELAEGLVLTKGQERCLYVFPQAEFGRITEALRTAPVTAKAVRDYSRVFFASASDEVPDKQNR